MSSLLGGISSPRVGRRRNGLTENMAFDRLDLTSFRGGANVAVVITS